PDLIESVPGLQVIRSRGRHSYTVASVRGSTSSQVAVYVDGVLMNLQSEAAVDLSSIPVDNVLRIEVYRGYIPAKFGAQAMGGVINIVTKQPTEPETNVTLGAGSFGRYKGNVSYGAPLGDGTLFAAFGYETYDGDYKYWNDNGTPYNATDDYTGKRRDNGFENMDLLLKWQDEHWRAKASWVRNDRDLALPAPGIDKPGMGQQSGAKLDTDRVDVLVGRTQTAGAVNWDWELKYTDQKKDYDSRRGDNLSQIGAMNVSKSSYDTTRFGATVTASWSAGERHFFEALLDYSDERLKIGGATVSEYLGGTDKYTREGWSATLQDTVALDAAGTLLLTPSLRWHKEGDDDEFTWQVALAKEFGPAWMLKAAYGTYARAPNMYEQYGDGAFILPAANNMKWETGEQFDLGVAWTGNAGRARSNVSLAYFWRETDDLIEFNMESPRYGRYANIAHAKVRGVELETGLDWEKWAFTLSGTWMDGKNETPDHAGSTRQYGKTLPNRPEWSGTARLTRKFDRASAFVEYQYIGENYADSSEQVLFDSRNVWNVGVKYRLSPTAQLIAGIDDVFDEADDWRMRANGPTRMLWHPIEGRSYYLTLMMEF
ncbi:TonB-dependent receptor, partial [Synergistaceae bacterium OttesenSCG-928-I11]|nr:TonB-dependent receptor [Synergistaceae bacterium OttesenSCG-928-I11]